MHPILLVLICGLAAAEPPCWPLDLETRYLTGNFMEPRGGRFHAGLDLKTDGRTGYRVLAASDGHVSRVRLSPTGYGKAIYLTAADGSVYVYAHLDRLRDDLRDLVRQRQRELGRYAVDLWLPASACPVARGEVLALSGQTATAGPHLHFEVRGPDGQPRDPLAHGFAVSDARPPEILAVRAVRGPGQDPASLLIGDGRRPLTGRLPELHVAAGPLFLTALIIERSDRHDHSLGPWRVRLLVDGREVFAAVNDSLRWDVNHHQQLEYRDTDLGPERWLRVDRRNGLPGRRGEAWLESGDWPAGRRQVELIAEDRAGNIASAAWTMVIGEAGTAVDDRGARPGGWRPDADLLRDPWLVAVAGAAGAAGTVPRSPLSWAVGPLLDPAADRSLHEAGLTPLGPPVQFRLEGAGPLLQAATIDLPAAALAAPPPAADPAVGVYRLHRRSWRYEGPLDGGPDAPSFDLAQPGVYRVMRDGLAPRVETAGVPGELVRRPQPAEAGITPPAWPVVPVAVVDGGSGVDWHGLSVLLDGEPLIAEPDPPRDRILVELPDRTAAGRRRLQIAVADRAGQRTTAVLELTLLAPVQAPPPPPGAGAEAAARPSP